MTTVRSVAILHPGVWGRNLRVVNPQVARNDCATLVGVSIWSCGLMCFQSLAFLEILMDAEKGTLFVYEFLMLFSTISKDLESMEYRVVSGA